MSVTHVKINNYDELLKTVSLDEAEDFFIYLGNGLRSSKNIYLLEDSRIEVCNEIDDSIDILDRYSIYDESVTNIGKAMEDGIFYRRVYDNS